MGDKPVTLGSGTLYFDGMKVDNVVLEEFEVDSETGDITSESFENRSLLSSGELEFTATMSRKDLIKFIRATCGVRYTMWYILKLSIRKIKEFFSRLI